METLQKTPLGGSKIGRKLIAVPSGVEVSFDEKGICITGKRGNLFFPKNVDIKMEMKEGGILLTPRDPFEKKNKAFHGLYGSYIRNMLKGVSEGFLIQLDLVGTGYRAKMSGDRLELALGFSHPVLMEVPEGIKVQVPEQNKIIVEGIDKQKVGQFSADIRKNRPPEPYKGKGIHLSSEVVRRKAGKSGKK